VTSKLQGLFQPNENVQKSSGPLSFTASSNKLWVPCSISSKKPLLSGENSACFSRFKPSKFFKDSLGFSQEKLLQGGVVIHPCLLLSAVESSGPDSFLTPEKLNQNLDGWRLEKQEFNAITGLETNRVAAPLRELFHPLRSKEGAYPLDFISSKQRATIGEAKVCEAFASSQVGGLN